MSESINEGIIIEAMNEETKGIGQRTGLWMHDCDWSVYMYVG